MAGGLGRNIWQEGWRVNLGSFARLGLAGIWGAFDSLIDQNLDLAKVHIFYRGAFLTQVGIGKC